MRYIPAVRGREKGKVALRQVNKVSWARRCVLDLGFHVTSWCVCYCFDSRLKGEGLDWAWLSPKAAGILHPKYLGRGLEVGIVQHFTDLTTAAIVGSQPGRSSSTSSVCFCRGTESTDGLLARCWPSVPPFPFTRDNPKYKQVKKNVVKEIGIKWFLCFFCLYDHYICLEKNFWIIVQFWLSPAPHYTISRKVIETFRILCMYAYGLFLVYNI